MNDYPPLSDSTRRVLERDANFPPEYVNPDPMIPVDLSSRDELARSIYGALEDCPHHSGDKVAGYIAAQLWAAIQAREAQANRQLQLATASVAAVDTLIQAMPSAAEIEAFRQARLVLADLIRVCGRPWPANTDELARVVRAARALMGLPPPSPFRAIDSEAPPR